MGDRSLAFARFYRPRKWEEVMGQEHVKKSLKNQIEKGHIHHAFLFYGPRGVGKTTMARLLASSVNCNTRNEKKTESPEPCGECAACLEIREGRNLDVIEIDGASHNSVDHVREIQDTLPLSPAKGPYKIYIIDEVHMLSTSAFNALLKSLEEPPPHVIFIFATTEKHKIPMTVVSRCQEYHFQKLREESVLECLKNIAKLSNVEIEDDALFGIYRATEGSMRDAIGLLEQLSIYADGTITSKHLQEMAGIFGTTFYRQILDMALGSDRAGLYKSAHVLREQGLEPTLFLTGFLSILRSLEMIREEITDPILHERSEEEIKSLGEIAPRFSAREISTLRGKTLSLMKDIKWMASPFFLTEGFIVSLADFKHFLAEEDLFDIATKFPRAARGALGPSLKQAPNAAPAPAPPPNHEVPPAAPVARKDMSKVFQSLARGAKPSPAERPEAIEKPPAQDTTGPQAIKEIFRGEIVDS